MTAVRNGGKKRLIKVLAWLAVAGLIAPGTWLWWWHFSQSLFPLDDHVVNSAGTFSLGASLPVPRTESGGTVCDGKFYLAGGLDAFGRTLSSFMAYDPASDQWDTLPNLPRPINHPGVVSDGEKIYIVGGFDHLGFRPHGFMLARWDPLATLFVYDPAAGEWSRGPDLPEPRGAGGVCVADGAIWYVGGINPAREISNELFRYDLFASRWTTEPSMPTKRDHFRMEAVEGKLYAISGREDDLRKNLSVVERFDIESGMWSRMAEIPYARGGFGSAVIDGYIYTFGGEYVWTCLTNIERYDPREDRWETVGELPEGRHGICAGVLNGRVHLVSGGRHPRLSISGIHRIFVPDVP